MILTVMSEVIIGGFYHEKTHLSIEDRIIISQMFSEQHSFKQIALAVNINCTSISREVINHMEFRRTGGKDAHTMHTSTTGTVLIVHCVLHAAY